MYKIKQELITFETAKALYDIGFNVISNCKSDKVFLGESRVCRNYEYLRDITKNVDWDSVYLRPTQNELRDWLLEQHEIFIDIRPFYFKDERFEGWEFYQSHNVRTGLRRDPGFAKTCYEYHQALTLGFQQAFELIKGNIK